MAKLFPAGETVTDGEQRMLLYLERALPDRWFIVSNVFVYTGKKNREIDAVIIGDHCIWVVNEKSYSGTITGDIHTWVLSDGSQEENIIDKAQMAARVVRGKIRKMCPDLKHVYVNGVVLLSADKVRLCISDPEIGTYVRHLQGCEEWFSSSHTSASKAIQKIDREAILRSLIGDVKATYLLSQQGKRLNAAREIMGGDLFLKLEGEDGFHRIYFEDVLLGRQALRGAKPRPAVEKLKGTGLHVRFCESRVWVMPLSSFLGARLGTRVLKPSEWVPLRKGVNTLLIDEIKLKATVSFQPGGEDE